MAKVDRKYGHYILSGLEDREIAEDLRKRCKSISRSYGSLSLADACDLAGISCDYMSNQIRWNSTDVIYARIMIAFTETLGWCLVFPTLEPGLDPLENEDSTEPDRIQSDCHITVNTGTIKDLDTTMTNLLANIRTLENRDVYISIM